MATIQYEELDSFFEQVTKLNKDRTIYMTVVRTKKETVMAGAVRVMFKDEHGVLHQYNHVEDIHEFQMVDVRMFDMLLSPENSKVAKEKYVATVQLFENELKRESDKLREVLTKEFGAVKIYNAYAI